MLAGRYRLDRSIKRGGMGEVWRGHDLRLGRAVAVKVQLADDPDPAALRRFQREAALAAGLQHPGIIVVYDTDKHDGQTFIVMELLRDEDLGAILKGRPGGLPVRQVLDYGIQVADALAAAHHQGIVHRDLKPGNIMVQPDGRLKVCDFGLAKDLNALSRVTGTGEFLGTPAYMAPEQWRGEQPTPSADLYALGCILHEMLTGGLPFPWPLPLSFMQPGPGTVPVPPRVTGPAVPSALSDLLLSLLAVAPQDRSPDAPAVRASLTRIRGSLSRAPAAVPAGRNRPPVACAKSAAGRLTFFALDAAGRIQRYSYSESASGMVFAALSWSEVTKPPGSVTALAAGYPWPAFGGLAVVADGIPLRYGVRAVRPGGAVGD